MMVKSSFYMFVPFIFDVLDVWTLNIGNNIISMRLIYLSKCNGLVYLMENDHAGMLFVLEAGNSI